MKSCDFLDKFEKDGETYVRVMTDSGVQTLMLIQDRSEKWGVGNKADAKTWMKARVGKTEVDLIFGEHPHSRRDNRVYARWPKDGKSEESWYIVGFSGHTRPVKIEIQESNYLKTSGLSGDEVRRSCHTSIYFSDILTYSFSTRGYERALQRASLLVDDLVEHPLFPHLLDGTWKGRKVYYRDCPCVLTHWMPDQGAMAADAEPGAKMSPWGLDIQDGVSDPLEDGNIKTDLFDRAWWWFRE